MTKIKIEKPPMWDNLCDTFNIQPVNAVYTYGDTIYNPDDFNLPDDIIEHEKVHMNQQNHSIGGAALWWGKWLREPEFRIDQEAQAYAKQYLFLIEDIKDRERKHKVMMDLSRSLSGRLYNHAISHTKAFELIKKYTNGR